MVALFFGDLLSILSTVFLIAALVYIGVVVFNQKRIELWGRKVFILAITGLILCCLVVTRDDYVNALQGGTGFFSLESIQIYLAYIGGAAVAFASLSSVFVHNQKYRKVMFFILSGSIVFKAALIEVSRIIMS